MTLRKIPVDNSVEQIAQSEKTQSFSSDSKPNMIENNSLPREKKNFIKL